MSKPSIKRQSGDKSNPSDEEIMQEIKEDVQKIRQSNRSEVQKIQEVHELYNRHKENKRRREMMERNNQKKFSGYENRGERVEDSESEEEGQVNEMQPKRKQLENQQEQNLTTQERGELIKQITLTRKRLIQFLDNRKFNDLVKGCFVRYKGYNTKDDSYMIAQIIDVKQGTKQYTLTSKHKTKILLIIQESRIKIVQLPIEMVSNQGISGTTQITKWIQENGDRIPKERQITEKLEQHNRLLTEQLSSQQIDKNIYNRAVAMSKGTQEIKSLEDLQNLLDFVVQKFQGYAVEEEEECAKRKDTPLELIQIKRKKQECEEVKKNLEERKREWIEAKGESVKVEKGEKIHKTGGGLKIEEKREDEIKEKWRLREMMLCTAEGYEKIRGNLVEKHTRCEIEFEV